MLDYRHETFLALCRVGSYTKTAELLHLTQPAVSQHIRYLEELYGGKLLHYQNKSLSLTARGRQLLDFASRVGADSDHLRRQLRQSGGGVHSLRFGATLTVGEYLCPRLMTAAMAADPALQLSLRVANTHTLLQELREGSIRFALVEGFYDKTLYDSALLTQEPFVAVAAPAICPKKTGSLGDLLELPLLLREPGSGRRDIIEQLLQEENLSAGSFLGVCEVGSLGAIKQLAVLGQGVSFLYRRAVVAELAAGTLAALPIRNGGVNRQFNMVWLKGSLHRQEYLELLRQFRQAAAD